MVINENLRKGAQNCGSECPPQKSKGVEATNCVRCRLRIMSAVLLLDGRVLQRGKTAAEGSVNEEKPLNGISVNSLGPKTIREDL